VPDANDRAETESWTLAGIDGTLAGLRYGVFGPLSLSLAPVAHG
jgi:hypothetical protein